MANKVGNFKIISNNDKEKLMKSISKFNKNKSLEIIEQLDAKKLKELQYKINSLINSNGETVARK